MLVALHKQYCNPFTGHTGPVSRMNELQPWTSWISVLSLAFLKHLIPLGTRSQHSNRRSCKYISSVVSVKVIDFGNWFHILFLFFFCNITVFSFTLILLCVLWLYCIVCLYCISFRAATDGIQVCLVCCPSSFVLVLFCLDAGSVTAWRGAQQ